MNGVPESNVDAAWVQLVASRLQGRIIGRPLLGFEEVGSTSDVAKQKGVEGAPEGLAVIARSQTGGRGRRGRRWESAVGQGVYLSVLVRPAMADSDAGWLALMAGVATSTALEKAGVLRLTLKWPNDVLASGRKIAGVLVEPRIGGSRIEFAVIGIGVNVAQRAGSWSKSIEATATSCRMEGVDATCEDVAGRLLNELDEWYACLRSDDHARLMNAWVRRGGTDRLPEIV
jgi:BirA family transcriptional regulator, biotin operon repressor / biotin---[acetyl-CoA-carboxylase] ligase